MLDILDCISNTSDGVLAVDREQRIVLWNQAAEMLLGFKAEEVRGRFCHEVFGCQDELGCLVCHANCLDVRLALRQELIPTRDCLVRTRAGREIWVSVSTVLVPSQWHDLVLLIHLFRDVSHQKELERSVKQLISSVSKQALPSEADSPLSPPVPGSSMDLTKREQQVLRLLASGTSTQAIAAKLFISPATARTHIHRILAKLGIHSRLEAVTLALRNSLI
jgi:PAS domain S-box-containing protein